MQVSASSILDSVAECPASAAAERALCAQTIRVPAGTSEQEEVQVAVTRVLVESYYALVRASLQDSVPKAVMHFLVLYVQRGLQQHLIRTLYRRARADAGPGPWNPKRQAVAPTLDTVSAPCGQGLCLSAGGAAQGCWCAWPLLPASAASPAEEQAWLQGGAVRGDHGRAG